MTIDMTSWSEFREWSGSAAELSALVGRLLPKVVPGASPNPPSERQVRDWRVKGVFTHGKGSRFQGRQVLECLAAVLLKERGLRLDQVAALTASSTDEELEQALMAGWSGELPLLVPAREPAAAEDAAVLLAQGVLQLYDRVLVGQTVRQEGHVIPSTLHAAMSRLGRLYLESGQPDQAACVHDVLDRARRPLSAWQLPAFRTERFGFGDAVLLDPVLRVPTADCVELASQTSTGEVQLIEERLHKRLLSAADRVGLGRRDEAYSKMREFVVRRPLVRHEDVVRFCASQDLRVVLRDLLSFYTPAPSSWTVDGELMVCGRCQTMLRPSPAWAPSRVSPCVVRQCRDKGEPPAHRRSAYTDGEWLLALDPLQVYWVGPGLDEIQIHDAARAAGRDAVLYPLMDACDVSVDGHSIGIDAKSYTCPVALGRRLARRGVGRLTLFRRRIIAVGDELVDGRYLATVRRITGKSLDSLGVELMSVSEVIAAIEGA